MIKESFKFKDVKRFSPVIYGGDLPWEQDYYHMGYDQINKEFLKNNDYVIDDEWWDEQYERCINGYTVPNAIIEGGEVFTTKLLSYTDPDTTEVYTWGENLVINDDGTLYLPDLDLTINKNGDVHIPGRMYFYLNFWNIRRLPDGAQAGAKKIVSNPKFTDLSFENWCIRERMRKEGTDILWAKSRQKGLSEEEACDTMYDLIFHPDSQSVILAGEEKYNYNTYMMAKRGMAMIAHTQFYKEFSKDNSEECRTKYTGAEIYSRTCKDNSEAASGLSPSKAHMEEIGIWKQGMVKEVGETLDESLEAEGVRTGFRVYTGTGGSMENGVKDMQDMFYEPEKHNLMKFKNVYEDSDDISYTARFIPAYRFKIIDQDGNSLVVESIQYVLKRRKIVDIEKRYTRTVMNPLKPSEIFLTKEGGYFGKIIAQWCNERKAYLNTHRSARIVENFRGRWLDPKNPFKGVEMIPDPEGPFMIAEHPRKDKDGNVYLNLYRGGTDSYDQDESNYGTSKGACWIKKGFLNANDTYNKYVAGLLERPSTSVGGRKLFYEHSAMLCIYYNTIASNLIEHTKILIIDWYIDNGFAGLLKLRPQFVTANMIKKSNTSYRYGIDASTKHNWLAMQRDYLKDKANIDNCDFPILLDSWSKFKLDPKYNCDNTIATSLCTVNEEDEKQLQVHESNRKEEPNLYYTQDHNGNLVLKAS